MTLTKLSAALPDRADAHTVAGVLQELIEPAPLALTLFEQGAGWVVDAYFEDAPDERVIAAAIGEALCTSAPALRLEHVPDLNWVSMSQAALPPVSAGRYTIHGSHDRGRVPRGPMSIEIDAGEAFGTAHHATTWGCLEAIDRVTRRMAPRQVLDLGCGSGVLSIAVARAVPSASVLATDLDPQSVIVARSNARSNRVARQVEILRSTGLNHPRLRARRFDLAIANILAGPLIELAKSLASAIKPGGTLILSGILLHQANQVAAEYRAAGFALLRHRRVTGWSILTLTHRPLHPVRLEPRQRTSY